MDWVLALGLGDAHDLGRGGRRLDLGREVGRSRYGGGGLYETAVTIDAGEQERVVKETDMRTEAYFLAKRGTKKIEKPRF